MLGGDGEALAARGVRDVFILDQRGLLNDLTRVAQKLRALLREQNPPAVAQEDGDARFLLQLAHGGGKAGLGDKQRLCGLGDGAALGDLDDVFQLLKRHKKTFPGALPQTLPKGFPFSGTNADNERAMLAYLTPSVTAAPCQLPQGGSSFIRLFSV